MTEERAPQRAQALVGGTSGDDVLGYGSNASCEPRAAANLLARDHATGRSAASHAGDRHSGSTGRCTSSAGEGTRKGRNLAADDRCVIATTSTTLPALDIVIEGHAERLTDDATVRHVTEVLVGEQLAARGQRTRGLRPAWSDRRPAAVRDLPDRPDAGVRSPRDARDGSSSIPKICRTRRAGTSTRRTDDARRDELSDGPRGTTSGRRPCP